MEDTKPTVTEADNGISTVDSRFSEFCQSGLSLDKNAFTEAMKVFKETKHLLLSNISASGNSAIGNLMSEDMEKFWFACIIFSVKRLSQINAVANKSDNSGPNLCQILRSAKINIKDFFKELPQYIVKAGPVLSKTYGTDWESKLEAKELQANFEQLSILSRHYKHACEELFLTSDSNVDKESAGSIDASNMQDFIRFGWLLFLATRVRAYSRFQNLVTSTNGLVSVLVILIIHVPLHFRRFKFSDTQWFAKRSDKGVDLLASLCNKYDKSEEELKETMEQTNNLIAELLKKKSHLACESVNENLVEVNPDGLIYYDDLMEESSIQSSLTILEKDYDDAIRNKGELDERMFINEEDSLLGPGGPAGDVGTSTGAKRKFDMISSPTKAVMSPLSPLRSPASHSNGMMGGINSKVTATPVSTAMTTAKWLRTVISPLPSKPSAQLERFLTSCDRDLTNDVIRRTQIILEAIFPNSALGERNVTGNLQSISLIDNIWAEQRRLEALKLYYRVLEAICTAESQVLHATNLTSLLTNERFHRCMLACSAELVLATHKTVTMLFPAVLERTGITAFDLSKVIESFIRYEDSLPRELRRHLNSLEERLLESMVWEKGSSMYNSLAVAKPALSAEINRLDLLAEPMPSLDAIAMQINFSSGATTPASLHKHEASLGQNGDIRSPKRPCTDYRSVLVERNSFTSPVKVKSKFLPPALQSAFASPSRPNPGGGSETCAETGINVFFSKINKLSAVRISGMMERLHQSQQHIRENVYHLFQLVLSQRTYLFFNRHIDQIIMCCIYGVAKISKLNLMFRDIICHYRRQPQCKPQVFRSVFIDWSSVQHNAKMGQGHVDIITFYNEVFVPEAKPLLVEVGPAESSKTNQAPEISNKDGQCPASPKVSPFPSLPDMSPKKVSASHNVYVSPLRASKMDALISHSAKSYYACVGESTHAYQSPSKDLTTINNRLNGNRKVKGALNFDDVDVGLVSDSMVTNSLYLQNGSCASSSGAAVKSEQPDS